MTTTAYDYEAQRWLSGDNARRELLKQTREEIALLTSNRRSEFLKLIGITSEHADSYVRTMHAQEARLVRELDRS